VCANSGWYVFQPSLNQEWVLRHIKDAIGGVREDDDLVPGLFAGLTSPAPRRECHCAVAAGKLACHQQGAQARQQSIFS
jgi:hypothetical protein